MSDSPVTDRPELVELAQRLGVATDFWDWQGQHTPIAADTVVAVLRAFGLEAGDEESARDALREVEERPWRRMLPPVVVGRAGRDTDVLVHVTHGEAVEVEVLTEAGETLGATQGEHWAEPREVDGRVVGEARFTLPALPSGYHRVHASGSDGETTALLVVAPDRLDLPDLPRQAWGLMAQLYSTRSRDSWGLGDFADLATLARWGGGAGADFVLVNPLHAAEPVPPVEDSPYLPTSRRFLNPIYVRVEDVEEYATLAPAERAAVDAIGARLSAGNADASLLDRDATLAGKLEALAMVFASPRSQQRQDRLDAYLEREGAALTDFARWCALAEGNEDDPDRIAFHAWLQWVCDEQLAAAHAAALDAGMRVGVITDLAVGVHPAGAEVWTLGDALTSDVSVGAPPDAFNQLGQDWSQPPWRPDRLAELEYAPYRAMLRTVLRHAGALRIDHVMGLFRLWCIPQGAPPNRGTYLRYDHEAMVSILLLEAERAGAFVIGEDLGVVEPFVREYLAGRGVLGTSILWFEFEGDHPRPPEQWRELCLATVGTHDLPPTAAYLAGDHVRLRDSLGLLTRPLEEELAFAAHEREAFLRMLRERGLVGDGATEQETVEALHRLLTLTPSRLVGVQVSDLVGDRSTQNLPGTYKEHPNWRMPLSGPDGAAVLLEDLPGNERAASLARALERPDLP
ncbi:MAG: 4-alpha-glucanotransferase [Nocardioides sp.]|nr:4-alpha-glucanotransferase [Nocardioides sp.]